MNQEKVSIRVVSHKGSKKDENEDSYFIGQNNNIILIGDGSTGCNGKISSQSATGLVGREMENILADNSKEAKSQSI